MDWLDEVKIRYQKKNQILFTKNSAFLQDLILLFQNQTHKVLTLWAFDLAAASIAALEKKYPDEKRPRNALEAARAWAVGQIKMRQAQRKILDCHAFAKEIHVREDIATCHAIGQACSVVHTPKHAIGYPIYDLTAMVYRFGIENCSQPIIERKQVYIDKLFYWACHTQDYLGPWADFMY